MSEGHLQCVHTILFFRTNKESLIWRQNDHAKIVGAFHLSRRVSDENRAWCMIEIFRGSMGGDTFKTPSPLRTTFAFTHPLF